MIYVPLAVSMSALLYLGSATPVLAAPTPAAQPAVARTMTASSQQENASASQPAQKCSTDLSAFRTGMEKAGYEPGGYGDGLGYGYSMMGYGYGYPQGERSSTASMAATSTPMTSSSASANTTKAGGDYVTARPRYEVQTLLSSANILAPGRTTTALRRRSRGDA